MGIFPEQHHTAVTTSNPTCHTYHLVYLKQQYITGIALKVAQQAPQTQGLIVVMLLSLLSLIIVCS